MPHVIVKMIAGRSEEQKNRLADEITRAVMTAVNCEEKSVSVAIEDIASDWGETVYKPDIIPNWEKLYKKPGYTV